MAIDIGKSERIRATDAQLSRLRRCRRQRRHEEKILRPAKNRA
jgi:hypothetical protein